MNWNILVALPILLPLLGAGLAMVFGRRPIVQRLISVTTLTCLVVVSALMMWHADVHGALVLWVGGWEAPLGISLVGDRLSALMMLVTSVICLLVLFFSMGQDEEERMRETPISIFHPTYLAMVAGISNAFLTGDLFNLYVGFEILLFSSFVLLTLGGTGERVRAGTTYVIVSLVSSVIFLIALVAVYGATGTVNMAQAGVRLAELPAEVQIVVQMLLMLVFGIKAAIFPLSAWLPDSYPTAPAPVTAVFAGLLTKVGVYAMIRSETVLFPESDMGPFLLVIGVLTTIVGVLGAVAQSEIKRMLSFTLVSHIGYMVIGLGLNTDFGLASAIFYTAHHIIIQTSLFLVAGLIERRGGSTVLNELGGLAAASPVLGALFLIPALNLAGIPPMSGFIGKVGLIGASMDTQSFLGVLGVVALLVSSLLTLFAIAKVWNRAFWQKMPLVENEDGKMVEAGLPMQSSMVASAGALVVVSLAVSVVAGPLFDYTSRAAHDTRDDGYVVAVLPEEVRADG